MPRVLATAWKLAIVIIVWLAIGWVTRYLRPLDVSLGLQLPAWVQVPGIFVVAAGAALVMLCVVALGDRGIGTLRGEEWFMPREFVAGGPFRFVRNPMSLGGVQLMTGIALCRRSTLGLGLAAVLFLVFHLVIVFLEESGLQERFGDGYRRIQPKRASVDSTHHAVAQVLRHTDRSREITLSNN